ncbi:MAG: hypothetical protein K5840_05055 [Eubacterium sp.]|nr:hypothetical protein [Eubacterium sp.]
MASQEDYLDSLLNSVLDEDSFVSDSVDDELYAAQEGITDPFGNDLSPEETDDFLKEFDMELDNESASSAPMNRERSLSSDDMFSQLDDMIDGMGAGDSDFQVDDVLRDAFSGAGPKEAAEGGGDSGQTQEAGEPAPAEDAPVRVGEPQENRAPEEGQDAAPTEESPADDSQPAPDLAAASTAETMGELESPQSPHEARLMDIMSDVGDADVAEISDLLNSDENNIQIQEPVMDGAGDEGGLFKEDPAEVPSGDGKKKAKKEKDENAPRGVKGKVLFALFDDLEIPTGKEPTPEEIAQMEREKAEEKARRKEEKKAEKEAKKEAKKKLAEEKKAIAAEKKAAKAEAKRAKAAEKAAKKAEKKPKEKGPPVKKKPIIITLVFTGSMVLMLSLLANLGNYSANMTQAKSSYSAADYVGAFDSLSGLSIGKSDQDFYQKVKLMAGLQKCLQDYDARMEEGDELAAVDSLIRGAGKFNTNEELAGALGIMDVYSALNGQIQEKLNLYGISDAKALELYDMSDRDEYTVAIYELIS